MKTIIGYRFEIKYDNGDTNEWFREINIISDIYPTIDLVKEAYKLFIADEKEKQAKYFKDWIKFQKQFEKDEKAFIEEANKSCERQLRVKIANYNRNLKYVPVYINDTPTADVTEFNIAD